MIGLVSENVFKYLIIFVFLFVEWVFLLGWPVNLIDF